MRANDRLCSFCHLPLRRPADTEAPAPPVDEPAANAPPELSAESNQPLRTGRQHLLESLTASLGTNPTVIDHAFRSLAGVAVFSTSDQTVLVTLGFSELDVAAYAYDDSGLGYELVCRLEGPTPSPTLLEALDLLRLRSSRVGHRPHPFTEEDRWTMTFGASAPFEPLSTLNGRVQFFEVRIENKLERAQQELVSTATRAPERRTNARSVEDAGALTAFLAARDEVSAQVYSDWLEAEGDPRGELASLLRAGRHEAWLRANADLLFGDLAAAIPVQVRSLEWRHGFLEGVQLVEALSSRSTNSSRASSLCQWHERFRTSPSRARTQARCSTTSPTVRSPERCESSA